MRRRTRCGRTRPRFISRFSHVDRCRALFGWAWASQACFDPATTTHPNDFFPGAPDVAIEIVSPSDQWSRVTAKIEIYAREGAQYSVAIDPRKARCFALGALPDGIMLDIDAVIRDGK